MCACWVVSIAKKDALSQNILNFDLKKVSEWAHKWKMLINLEPRKEPKEVCFSRGLNHNSPLSLDFKDNTVQTVKVNENLGISLD